MSIIIKGATSGNLAEVDSNNNLKVNLPTVLSGSGYAVGVSEVDDGSVVGTRTLRQFDSSQDYRLRTGYDKILWQDTFCYTLGNVNISRYGVTTSVMTNTVAGGFWTINNGNSVTSGHYVNAKTFRTFNLYNTYPLYYDLKAKFNTTLQSNSNIEFGLGYAPNSIAIPTDGIYFRASSGQLNAVINNNGNEVIDANIFTPVANTVYHFLIVIGQDSCEFWVDDILVSQIDIALSNGSPCQSNSLPLLFRMYNTSAVPSAIQFSVAQVGLTLGDMDSGKDWGTLMVGMGQSSISIPDGVASSQSANFVNSAAPASATLSNTAAGYTTLGGQFQFAAVAGAETDYALFGYQNPAGSATVQGKNLIITGIRIDTFNTVAAVATTATVLQWSLGAGSTTVSLATTDSTIAAGRAPRRIPLGIQTMPIGTAVGAMATPTIDITFSSPIIVEPSTWLHVVLKMPIATATATEIIRGMVLINGYFE